MKALVRIISVCVCVAMLCLSLAGCGEKTDGKLKVGVIQYMTHASLDNCYNGIEQALKASGLDCTIERQIGSAETAAADCSTYAQNMVAQGCDVIVAIATPAATAAYAAVNGTDIPLIFCSVSDPVAAELVKSLDAPGGQCTGTSDVLDLAAQMKMIMAVQPDVKTVGVLYTTSEQNSITQLANLKEVCQPLGIAVEAGSVQNGSDIPAAATALASKVDCITNFTDNNVVENLSVLLDAANAAGIPVYGSEVEQVSAGCLASESIDYVAVGKATGEMAVKVLNGEDPATMPVQVVSETTPVFNSDVLAARNMSLPAGYENATTVTTKK